MATPSKTTRTGPVEGSVLITGLRELQAAYRSIDRELPKLLRVAMKGIADHVVGVVQQRMPWESGEAAKSLKPRATQLGAGIARPAGGTPWRGEKADYSPWLDFGGAVGRKHSVIRPVVKGGRYLYPAIAASKGETLDEAAKAIKKAASDQGFETKGF
jgi:hypothetical protein